MQRFVKAEDIKVGVIGYGPAFNMGPAHLNQMKQAGMTPAAVCDKDEARLEAAQQDFPGIETYTDLDEMLAKSDVNLLAIITPHNTHADLAMKCLEANRHVMCEKPLAITTEECDRMIEMASKKGLVLSTYHNRHWDGCILQAVKKVRDEQIIGDIVRIEAHMGAYGKPGDWWRSSKSISGGILYDFGAHLLEYSLQLIDAGIVEVTGLAKKGFWADQTAWKDDCNEDEATAVVRFDNGSWLFLTMTHIDSNPKKGWLEITGTKGTYIFDHGTWEAITHGPEGKVVYHGNSPQSEGWRFYQNIADHMVKGDELIISGEWARRPIHIMDLAGRSAAEGRALPAQHK